MAEDEAIGESQVGALHGTESSLEKECLAWKLLYPGRNGTLMMTFVTWGGLMRFAVWEGPSGYSAEDTL